MTMLPRMVCAAFLVLLARPVSAAGPDTEPAAAPQSLRIETGRSADGSFALAGRDSWQQLLVTGQYAGGQLRDLTRAVAYETAPLGIVAVDATGLVMPLKEGQATLRVKEPGGATASVRVTVTHFVDDLPINFASQVVPLFTRFGCNAGGCHGKAGGQNGFALSLLGFEPQEDYEYVVKEARGRRLLPAAPDDSLLLRKAAGLMAHGGGKRLEPDSAYYRLLRRWVAQGATQGRPEDPVVTRIEVLPGERTVPRGGQQQLVVIAHRSDGSTEDVTRLAQFEVNEPELADVSPTGLVSAKRLPGAVAVMARFQTHVAVFRALIPLGASVDRLPPARNFIDELVFKQLTRLGIPPSAPCPDSAFIRRATIDIAGRLPTLEETRAFLADRAPDRHEKLVERLLASEDYAYYFAGKWASILRNRRASPTDDTAPTFAFHAWIKEQLHANRPFDQFVRDILTASGEEVKVPPVVWYREVREPSAQLEDVAQLFLGQRIGCAKCHHHPFERWTQDDYWGLAAFFSRLDVQVPVTKKQGKKVTKLPAQVAHKAGVAQALNPRTNRAVKPRGLGSREADVSAAEDPRGRLVDWMVAPENPYFARTLANRYWKHFFGRGLVEAEDDLRATNPPTNPELLDALARHVVDSKYDLKQLIRTLCTSTAYRLSAVPSADNAADRQNYSHFYVRRLHAEVLLDAVDVVTGSTTIFKGLPEGTRAVQLPDNQFPSYFLSVFGRPESASPCECERGSGATLAQALYLFNSEELLEKVRGRTKAPKAPAKGKKNNAPKGAASGVVIGKAGARVQQFLKDARPDRDKMRELYLRALSREPTAEELTAVLAYLDRRREDRAAAYEDILWAVLNTKEFLSNH